MTNVSVRLSVKRVLCDKTTESSSDILIPYERKIRLLFRTQRMVGGGMYGMHTMLQCVLNAAAQLVLYYNVPEILGQTDPPSFKTLQKR